MKSTEKSKEVLEVMREGKLSLPDIAYEMNMTYPQIEWYLGYLQRTGKIECVSDGQTLGYKRYKVL